MSKSVNWLWGKMQVAKEPKKMRVVAHRGTTITVGSITSQLQAGDVLVLKRRGVIARFIMKMIEWWGR